MVRLLASLVGLALLILPATAEAQYFGRNKVQYEHFDFKVLQTDHFDVYFYPNEREAADIGEGMRTLVGLLDELGVQLRDPEMGLVDFPGERDGKPVWLCWRLADPNVAHWHGTDEGYASRRPW